MRQARKKFSLILSDSNSGIERYKEANTLAKKNILFRRKRSFWRKEKSGVKQIFETARSKKFLDLSKNKLNLLGSFLKVHYWLQKNLLQQCLSDTDVQIQLRERKETYLISEVLIVFDSDDLVLYIFHGSKNNSLLIAFCQRPHCSCVTDSADGDGNPVIILLTIIHFCRRQR